MTCSLRSLASASRSLASRTSSSSVLAARPGAGDRVHGHQPVPDGDQRLRRGADDGDRLAARGRQPQQVHVRARVGGPQHPVDVQRVGRRWARRTAGTARSGRRRRPGCAPWRPPPWPGSRSDVRPPDAPRRLRARTPRRAATIGAASCCAHRVQPGDGVVVGVVDPLVGGVPVHRVGDQRDGALVVVQRGQVGGEQHHQFRDAAARRRRRSSPAVRVDARRCARAGGRRRSPR